ncbi:MAG: hypothetical protein LBF15_01730 [Candidatus Peribacteria bacterium]|jgi:hypothetical protein|nr:hypothetical protein [Candidatus Peribacteria bacterium]
MPAFATPDYDETALGGYDNVEDFGANKGRVNDNAYGNERKEACSYLWKDLKSSTYGDYTWDSCF